MKRTAALLALLCVAWMPNAILAQTIDTIAGTGAPGLTGDGGPATSATMRRPKGMVLTATGLLFADDQTHTVRHIDFTTGIITRFAGNGSPSMAAPGTNALAAGLGQPIDLAFDALGDVLIVEAGNGRLVKVDAANTIQVVAGTGAPGGGGDGGPARFASLDDPVAVDVDGAGNIYVLEKNMSRVRKIDAVTGIINTVVGLGFPGFSGDGGPATNARLNRPEGLAVSTAGDLYIADTSNRRIRFVNATTGIITTAAGGGSLPGDGPANLANLNLPYKVALAADGTVLFTERAKVRQYNPVANTVTTLAGSGTVGFGGDGGPPLSARLNDPRGIAGTVSSLVYVADTGNLRIREIDQTPVISGDVILDGTETQAELDAITDGHR